MNDINTTIRDEMIYNALYAIYTENKEMMRIIMDEPDKFVDRTTTYTLHIVRAFHKYNRTSLTILPHHMRAIENKEAYDHGTDNTQGKHVLVRFQMLMPDLKYNMHALSNETLDIYANTWCKNNTYAKIEDRKIKLTRLDIGDPIPDPGR